MSIVAKWPLGTEVGLGLGHTVLDGDLAPPPKRAQSPIFGPCLLWPNGWMDQDATLYRGRPRHRRHCVRWRPSSPTKGHRPQFLAHACCCNVGVLWPNGWMDQDVTWHGGRPRPKPHYVRWASSSAPPLQKWGTAATYFSVHVYCGQTVAHLSYC